MAGEGDGNLAVELFPLSSNLPREGVETPFVLTNLDVAASTKGVGTGMAPAEGGGGTLVTGKLEMPVGGSNKKLKNILARSD